MRSRTMVLVLLLVLAVFPGWSLTFQEVLAFQNEVPALESARLEWLQAEKEASLASYAGDPSVSLTPLFTAKTAEGGTFAAGKEVQATLSASLPLGLSQEEGLKAVSAAEALDRSEQTYLRARGEAFVTLLTLYQEAWLAQEEEALLALELEAAAEQARVFGELFERGQTSLQELNEAEDLWGEAQTALIEGTLNRRLSWLELAFQAGMDSQTVPELEPVSFSVPSLPRPPELSAWGVAHSPELKLIEDQLLALDREDQAPGALALSSIRLSFSGWDQSGSLAYTPENPALSLNYTSPPLILGEDLSSPSSSSSVWQLGLAASLSWEGSGMNRMEADLRTLERESLQERWELQKEILYLQIRSRNQRYLLSQSEVDQALALLEQIRGAYDLVLERGQTQRATLAEELFARIQLKRAEFRYQTGLVRQREAAFELARAAYWLEPLLESLDVIIPGEEVQN